MQALSRNTNRTLAVRNAVALTDAVASVSTVAPSRRYRRPELRQAPSKATPSVEEQVREYLPLVETLSRQAAMKYGFRASLDELRSAAALGLLEAIHRYEDARGIPFGAFARHRISGAILDEVRGKDELSRPARRRAREVEKARKKLVRELKREPAEDELAKACGEKLDEFHRRATLDRAHEVESLDALAPAISESLALDEDDALDTLCRAEELHAMGAAVSKLPERVRVILAAYYEDDRSYRDIGEELGVSESRICQIVRGALKQLRAELQPAAI